MILELEGQRINIKKNSVEDPGKIKIMVYGKDFQITNEDEIKILIGERELIKKDIDVFELDSTFYIGKEERLFVIIKKKETTKIFQTTIELKQYISFGPLDGEKFPQSIIDQNKRFKELEDRIKKIEKKINVI